MPPQLQLFKPAICLLVLPLFFSSFKPSHREKNHHVFNPGFAVVELFTSEGCSSCPPAEEAVGRLTGWKKNLYFLCFHVDYWNYLGWKDLYSNPAYTIRQKEYGAIFHLNSIYTPQAIVNGKVEFTGSNESRLRETIEESISELPKSEIQITVQRGNKNQIQVIVNAESNQDLTLNLALVQQQVTNAVQRGENKGKSLTHFNTVRDFMVLPDDGGSKTYDLNIPNGLSTSDCSVIAYLQNSKNGHIVAATSSAIP